MIDQTFKQPPHTLPGRVPVLILTGALIVPVSAQAQTPWVPANPTAVAPGTPMPAIPWASIPPPGTNVNVAAWKMHVTSHSSGGQGFHAQSELENYSNGPMNVAGFGSGPGDDNAVTIVREAILPAVSPLTTTEENGSYATATNTGLTSGQGVRVSSVLGDGAFGTTSGDFDMFRLAGLSAGQTISASLVPDQAFFPVVVIYDGFNRFFSVGFGGAPGVPASTSFVVPFPGDWYVLVAGADTFTPDAADPGAGLGAGSTGSYELEIGLDRFVEQDIQVTLRKGDILGAAINGDASAIQIIDPDGDLRFGSGQDLSGVYPSGSPLPGGRVSGAYVVDKPGVVTVRVTATGEYYVSLSAERPHLERFGPGLKQKIFIDFDGGVFNLMETLAFDDRDIDVTLSPLSAFLPDWGLSAADENAVIDAILSVVRKSLDEDLAANGGNPGFEIEILNSRDHPDPWGQLDVSRVIVGGTIEELQISTIGIAGSIDPGNYQTEETAYVLLDILSGRVPSTIDLKGIDRAPGATLIDVIGVGVGEIVAHEAGHYLGSFHTDQFNAVPNIMDQGGNIQQSILGLGPDNIFGTPDDVDVEFERDVFVPAEGLIGEEDTATLTAWGCTTTP